MAVGHNTGKPVKQDLKTILDKIRNLSIDRVEQVLDAANNKENNAYKKIEKLIQQEWQSLKETKPNKQEILTLLQRFYVQVFDFEQTVSSKMEMLLFLEKDVVLNREQVKEALSCLLGEIRSFSPKRSGANKNRLKQTLLNDGITLKSSPRFESDISKLKAYSQNRLRALKHLSYIEFENDRIIIQRSMNDHLMQSIQNENLLVIGAPGAGKSGCLYQLAQRLNDRDVVVIPIDQKDENLCRIVGFENGHELPEVLKNWTGEKHGFLIIDALDAARSGRNLQEICSTLKQIKEIAPRWRIIASVREYDLRCSRDLQNLFKCNDIVGEFNKTEFAKVNHIYINTLTSEEQQQIYSKAHIEDAILQNCPIKFKELLGNIFNLKLFIELLSDKIDLKRFSSIDSQVELLQIYWEERIKNPDEELVIECAVNLMIESRSLECLKREVERSSNNNSIHSLLSNNIFVETNTNLPSINKKIAFSHNILYDFATYWSWLGTLDKNVIKKLSRDENQDLFLVLRPSITMAFQKLWHFDKNKFWDRAIAIVQQKGIRLIGENVAASVAATEFYKFEDLENLIEKCSDADYKGHPIKVLKYFIQAGLANKTFEPEKFSFYGKSAADWAKLAEHLSLHLNDEISWPLRTIIVDTALAKKEELSLTAKQALLINKASIRLLKHSVAERNSNQIRIASGAVCFTMESDPSKSIEALKNCLDNNIQEDWYETMPELCSNIFEIGKYDTSFALYIAKVAFSAKGSYDEKVHGGSKVLPLTFNKKDLLSNLSYRIREVFKKEISQNPLLSLQILCTVLKSVIYSGPEKEKVYKYHYDSKECLIHFNSVSMFKLDNIYEHENYYKLYQYFKEFILKASTNEILKLIETIKNDSCIAIWVLFMDVGTQRPKDVGVMIWNILTCPAVLYSYESREISAKLLAAVYPHLNNVQKQQIEATILSIPDVAEDEYVSENFGDIAMKMMIEALPIDHILDSKIIIIAQEPDLPKVEKPFKISMDSESSTEDYFLRKEGVPIDEPQNVKIRLLKQKVSELRSHDSNNPLTLDRILLSYKDVIALSKLYGSSGKDGVHESLSNEAEKTIVQWCERVSTFPKLSEVQDVYSFVRKQLLFASKHKIPEYRPESDDEWDKNNTGWGTPSPRIDAANGLMNLLMQLESPDQEILDAVKVLSSDPVHAVRHQISVKCLYLYKIFPDFMWELIEYYSKKEERLNVLSFFMHYVINQSYQVDGERLLPLVDCIYERVKKRKHSSKVLQDCTNFYLRRAIWEGKTESVVKINQFVENPVVNSDEVDHIIHCARNLIVSNEKRPFVEGEEDVSQWTINILSKILKNSYSAIENFKSSGPKWVKEHNDSLEKLVRIINGVTNQIYFGLNVSSQRKVIDNSKEQMERNQKFFSEGKFLLRLLGKMQFAYSAYKVAQIYRCLINISPKEMIINTANLVNHSQEDGYQYDSMAVRELVEFVEEYLASYRSLLQEDHKARNALLDIMDIFIIGGWPEVTRLTYRLSEVYR